MATDLTKSIIQQQIALNSGSISIVNTDGNYKFVNSDGKVLSNKSASASNFLLSNNTTYQTNIKADVYNYAVGIFGGQNVPNEVVETLASMAAYYASQTGQSVQSLFNNGILLDQFMATINNLRGATSQIGYAGLNLSPNWTNNIVLRASIAIAMSPWDASGNITARNTYNSEQEGFVYYATDKQTSYVKKSNITGDWSEFASDEPVWPA